MTNGIVALQIVRYDGVVLYSHTVPDNQIVDYNWHEFTGPCKLQRCLNGTDWETVAELSGTESTFTYHPHMPALPVDEFEVTWPG